MELTATATQAVREIQCFQRSLCCMILKIRSLGGLSITLKMEGESLRESIKRHEHFLALQLGLKPGKKVLDAGCGIGGPLREIAKFRLNMLGIIYMDRYYDTAKMISIILLFLLYYVLKLYHLNAMIMLNMHIFILSCTFPKTNCVICMMLCLFQAPSI